MKQAHFEQASRRCWIVRRGEAGCRAVGRYNSTIPESAFFLSGCPHLADISPHVADTPRRLSNGIFRRLVSEDSQAGKPIPPGPARPSVLPARAVWIHRAVPCLGRRLWVGFTTAMNGGVDLTLGAQTHQANSALPDWRAHPCWSTRAEWSAASLPRFWIRCQWIQSGGLHGGRTAQQSVLPWSTLKEPDYKAEQRADAYSSVSSSMLTAKHSLQRAAHSLDFEYHTKTQQPSRACSREPQTG